MTSTPVAPVPAPPATHPVQASVVIGPQPRIASRGIACDRCPTAPAKARVVMASGDLYLCGHHVREGFEVLERTALTIEVDAPQGAFYAPMIQTEES